MPTSWKSISSDSLTRPLKPEVPGCMLIMFSSCIIVMTIISSISFISCVVIISCCIHVCIYACMHVCMYACVHVCMYVAYMYIYV